jgi:peptidoglycan/LPS O-acetylase OafA/YrhL
MTEPVRQPPFDLRDTWALKTIGILAIVLHNLYHSLPHAVIENEFGFVPGHFQRFLQVVVDPRLTFQTLFSYLGHFGVQLFIFVSAYGLALKYWRTPSWSDFVRSRIQKLYPMFLLAVGLWLFLRLIEYGAGFPAFLWSQLDELALTTLAIINLGPGYGLPPVGPWWFLPFIVQFYCLWPGIAWLIRRTGAATLVVLPCLCLGLVIVAGQFLTSRLGIDLVETPVGHMPEICLGVAYARYGIRVGALSALAAAGVFLLGNVQAAFWPLTFVSALVMLLFAYQIVAPVIRPLGLIRFVADISMPLFFVNGFMRSPFRRIAIYFDRWYVTLLAGLAEALFSIAVAYGMLKLEQRILAPEPRPATTPEPVG